jgi:hypothetical protein
MSSVTGAIVIFVRDPSVPTMRIDGIVAAICPYLASFGEKATITSTETLRQLRAGDESHRVTVLQVSLAGTARVEFSILVSHLEKFLKRTAKEADIVAGFELYRVGAAEAPKVLTPPTI